MTYQDSCLPLQCLNKTPPLQRPLRSKSVTGESLQRKRFQCLAYACADKCCNIRYHPYLSHASHSHTDAGSGQMSGCTHWSGPKPGDLCAGNVVLTDQPSGGVACNVTALFQGAGDTNNYPCNSSKGACCPKPGGDCCLQGTPKPCCSKSSNPNNDCPNEPLPNIENRGPNSSSCPKGTRCLISGNQPIFWQRILGSDPSCNCARQDSFKKDLRGNAACQRCVNPSFCQRNDSTCQRITGNDASAWQHVTESDTCQNTGPDCCQRPWDVSRQRNDAPYQRNTRNDVPCQRATGTDTCCQQNGPDICQGNWGLCQRMTGKPSPGCNTCGNPCTKAAPCSNQSSWTKPANPCFKPAPPPCSAPANSCCKPNCCPSSANNPWCKLSNCSPGCTAGSRGHQRRNSCPY